MARMITDSTSNEFYYGKKAKRYGKDDLERNYELLKTLKQELPQSKAATDTMPIAEGPEEVNNIDSLFHLPPGEFGDSQKPIFHDNEDDSSFN